MRSINDNKIKKYGSVRVLFFSHRSDDSRKPLSLLWQRMLQETKYCRRETKIHKSYSELTVTYVNGSRFKLIVSHI